MLLLIFFFAAFFYRAAVVMVNDPGTLNWPSWLDDEGGNFLNISTMPKQT
jgi:hypothetical protein